ncbi:MAG TPA: outer membrane beta-barrel protein [Gemmatimonadaceae bacterium]|nr:outer membrane beta-barrel protein [Gemmatimonadaceae bacterium]
MRSLIRALIASSVLATPALAQAPESGTVLHVTPYAGAMIFGNYLSGPLGTSLSSKPSMLYGAQAGLSLSPQLSLVGNIGYTNSNMQVGLPILGGVQLGTTSVLLYDADLEYDLGNAKAGGTALSPFVQAGVGAMKYDVNAVSVINASATNLAGNVGVGADFTVGRGMALRVLARDYIGKFNFKDATGLGITGNTANNFGLTAGMRFDF